MATIKEDLFWRKYNNIRKRLDQIKSAMDTLAKIDEWSDADMRLYHDLEDERCDLLDELYQIGVEL
ncbi:MAG: hypothetical protein J6T35_02000 [Bacteroidales bacterium]|nr:hypothetical protein [Bacteroidales bacterium]